MAQVIGGVWWIHKYWIQIKLKKHMTQGYISVTGTIILMCRVALAFKSQWGKGSFKFQHTFYVKH